MENTMVKLCQILIAKTFFNFYFHIIMNYPDHINIESQNIINDGVENQHDKTGRHCVLF